MESEHKSRYELFLEEEARKAQPTKPCTKCKEVKALSEFHKHKGYLYGVRSACKKCTNKGPRYKDYADRFWKHYHSHTIRVGDCIEWTGGYRTDGYPQAVWHEDGKKTQTSVGRVVYRLSIGPLTDSDVVLLSCNNPRCVRHSHLVLATQGQREAKRRNKAAHGESHGRHLRPERTARGEHHGMSTLTEPDVRSIRELCTQGGLSYSGIGSMFGVSTTCVWLIFRRRTWKHVQ